MPRNAAVLQVSNSVLLKPAKQMGGMSGKHKKCLAAVSVQMPHCSLSPSPSWLHEVRGDLPCIDHKLQPLQCSRSLHALEVLG